jgi:hypothetical protein
MDRMRSFLSARRLQLAGFLVIAVGLWIDPALTAMLTGGGMVAIGAVSITDDVIKYLIKHLDAAGGWKFSAVKAKTADYTVVTGTDASGTVFTNRGASGAVIFTLPAPSQAIAGVFYDFLGVADQDVTVKTATVDTLLTKNDAAADSVAMSTSGEKIGGAMRFVCDGTAWIGFGIAVGHTFTVAT